MERIRQFLYKNNKTSPVLVPRVLKDMVSRYVCPTTFITCFDPLVACIRFNREY